MNTTLDIKDKPDAIRVVCRFRPINEKDTAECSVASSSTSHDIKFEDAQTVTMNAEFYKDTISHIVKDVLNGYNGTVLAYGQTGSGKTYSMMGDLEVPDMQGVIPRIVHSIFKTIMSAPSNLEFTVKVSFMEIYMEKIRDLLNPSSDNLPIHEDKVRGVYVKDLLEAFVSSADEVFEIMQQGLKARVVSSTSMNDESSRSHALFNVTVSQKNLDSGIIKNGKLALVDLAGSEKVAKTGATGQTLEEAKKINKSLSALGNVINSLTDGKSTHIPYRDSKLTRILQESIGGNSRTTLIINCAPSAYNGPETLSTLRFGVRAKTIKNSVHVNAELPPGELKLLLAKARMDLETFQSHARGLEKELCVWRSGSRVPEDQWISLKYMNSLSPAKTSNSLKQSAFSLEMSQDERDSFLERENELSDQLAEKESLLRERDNTITNLQSIIDLNEQRVAPAVMENAYLKERNKDLEQTLENLQFQIKEHETMSNTLKIANRDLLDHVERLKCQPQPNEDLAPKIGSLALNTSGMSRSDSSIRNESMYPDGQVDLLQEARSLLEESFPSSPTLDIEKDLELKIPSIQASPPARLSPKIEFLESSLDELSRIQKQLVDQNAELRKNASDAESKLKARAERIQALERSLKDSHERLDSHKASSIIETGRIVKPIRGGLHVTNDLSSRTGVRGDANATKSKWYVNLVTTNTRRP